MQEATLRGRQHGDAGRPAVAISGSRVAEAKRRRANVLFLLVLTTVCAGFLAATTDSKAMVYLFAVSLVALGGYVYLLVTLNQQQFGLRSENERRAPAPRQRQAARRRYADDDYDEDWYEQPARSAPPRRATRPAPAETYAVASDLPGSGQSGRISYGLGYDSRQPRRDPRDPYGRETYGWESGTKETVRRAPARNGRHATGQVPVQRTRANDSSSVWYTTAR
jgi:hypothetical protein